MLLHKKYFTRVYCSCMCVCVCILCTCLGVCVCVCVCVRVNEWESEWVTEWESDWVIEWLSDRVTEWVSEWVRERARPYSQHWPTTPTTHLSLTGVEPSNRRNLCCRMFMYSSTMFNTITNCENIKTRSPVNRSHVSNRRMRVHMATVMLIFVMKLPAIKYTYYNIILIYFPIKAI